MTPLNAVDMADFEFRCEDDPDGLILVAGNFFGRMSIVQCCYKFELCIGISTLLFFQGRLYSSVYFL